MSENEILELDTIVAMIIDLINKIKDFFTFLGTNVLCFN